MCPGVSDVELAVFNWGTGGGRPGRPRKSAEEKAAVRKANKRAYYLKNRERILLRIKAKQHELGK